MDIGKGDWVVAVKTSPSGGVQAGSVYFVEEANALPPGLTCKACGGRTEDGEFGLRLTGATVRDDLADAYGVASCYVHPLRKPPSEEVARTTRVCEPA